MAKSSASTRRQVSTTRFFRNMIAALAKQPAQRLFMIAAVLAMLIFGFVLAVQAITSILLFDGFAANGAFQLMNPLRRLVAGEVIGNDFNFFHGIGVPLVHSPFYYLFGQGLFGSEMARWIVSPLLFLSSAFVFFYAFRRRFWFAFSMTALVTSLSMLTMPFLALPLTSLLGVRSATAVFLLTVVLCQTRLKRPVIQGIRFLQSITWYEAVVALLLAVGFITGTEFGVAALLAFLIANTLYRVEEGQALRSRIFSSLRVLGLFAALLLGLLLLITRGTPLEPLKFALGEVPADQFWYFGVPPNNFLHLGNMFTSLFGDGKLLRLLVIALVASGLLVAVHRRRVYRVETQTFLFGLLAGAFAMVSMLGYYHYSEASALARMALLTGGVSTVLLWGYWHKAIPIKIELGKLKKRWSFGPPQALKAIGWFLIVATILYGVQMFAETKKNHDIMGAARKVKAYVLGQDVDILGREWQAVDEQVMGVVQADNTVAMADVTEDEFERGVHHNAPQVIVEPGEHAAFIRPGQIVYFVKSGRQVIKRVETRSDTQLLVTFADHGLRLDPEHDGAPAKLIVAEDFEHDNTKVWSLYSGLIESEMQVLQPTNEGYDYINHALGAERRKEYVDDFKRIQPQFVLTLGRPYFRYEEWVQNAHWDFYSLLDANYEVVKETAIYVVWKKRDQAWTNEHQQTQPWQPLAVNESKSKIDLPALSFDGTPNMEDYFRELQKAEAEHAKSIGKEPPGPACGDPAEHDSYIAAEARALREYEVFRRENSGPETDVTEHQQWLDTVSQGGSVLNVGPPPALCIERPKRQVILVKLTYETSHTLSKLPLFGKTTRYFVEPNNVYSRTVVSLKPYANEVVFPVVISEFNKNPYLRLNVDSLLPGSGKLDIKRAEWTTLDTSIANLKALTERP